MRIALLLALILGTRSAWSFDFVSCAEPGHETFDCATLAVPLDRSGGVPGTIAVAVERLRQAGPARPVLIALAGGPGQSAILFDTTFAFVFADVLVRYQLVVFDQRGTGRSGALDCPALVAEYTPAHISECAQSLGEAARFYTTADSVLDLDAVRAALGVEQVVVAGISYGTHVTLEYARTFPDRTAAIVLDSTLPPDGKDAFDLDSLGAARRVLGDLCSNDSCRAITRDPVADTAAMIRRLARPLNGPVIGADGKRHRRSLAPIELFAILVAGDLRPVLQARYPGAVAAARHGDVAPLLRLAAMRELADAGVRRLASVASDDSLALRLATICTDVRFPWLESDAIEVRMAALDAAALAVPASSILPFGRETILGSGSGRACIDWPITSLERASSTAAIPDVPALILGGTRDVRTPIENLGLVAALMPHAVSVVVPNQGHSLLTRAECARTSTTEFLLDLPVMDHCAGAQPDFPAQLPPPRSLARVRPVAGLPRRVGRALGGALQTLEDSLETAVTVFPALGEPVQAGGLRAGRFTGTVDEFGIHLVLERYTLVRGAALTGSIDTSADGVAADVDVRGPVGGHLRLGLDGSLEGKLGGRRFSGSLRSAIARAAVRVPKTTALPPIP